MAHEIHLSLASGYALRLRTVPKALEVTKAIEVTVFAGYHLHVRVEFHRILPVLTLRVVNTDLLLDSHAMFIALSPAEAAVVTAFLAMCKEGT